MSGNNQPEDLVELEARARWALEHPAQLEPRDVVDRLRVMLRLWHCPTFEQYSAWAVFIPRREALVDETRVLVREIIWDRPRDLQRILNPLEWLKQEHQTTPSLNVCDRELAYSHLSPLLDVLARLPVPVAGIQPLWGLDGETFGFEYGDSLFLRIRLEWWGDGPVEWEVFTECVARLRTLLQRLFHEDE